MSKDSEKLLTAALSLPREERISLAHELLSTVVDDGYPVGERVTAEQILRLSDEALSGKAKTVDAFEALDRLDLKYSREKAKAA